MLLITSLCCAPEHFENNHGKVPGLAGGQGVGAVFCAAVSVLDRLEHQCELEQKDESMQEQVSTCSP